MSSDWAVSALKWWSDAGVDVIVGEEPRDWLNPKPKRAAPPAAPAEPPLPSTLAEFQSWLLSSDTLPFAAPSAPRLGPAGDGSSGLMVLTDVPAVEDFGTGRLISSQGLFDKMLAAIGLVRESLYVASLSPLRPPSGNLDVESAARLSEIARHHIGLVAPRALLLLGDVCSRLLLGAAVAQTRSRWREIETNGGRIRALVTMKPEKLNLQPNLKKHAWADLQLLKEGLTE